MRTLNGRQLQAVKVVKMEKVEVFESLNFLLGVKVPRILLLFSLGGLLTFSPPMPNSFFFRFFESNSFEAHCLPGRGESQALGQAPSDSPVGRRRPEAVEVIT